MGEMATTVQRDIDSLSSYTAGSPVCVLAQVEGGSHGSYSVGSRCELSQLCSLTALTVETSNPQIDRTKLMSSVVYAVYIH